MWPSESITAILALEAVKDVGRDGPDRARDGDDLVRGVVCEGGRMAQRVKPGCQPVLIVEDSGECVAQRVG